MGSHTKPVERCVLTAKLLGTAITIYLPAYAGAKVDAPETSEREARHSQRPMVLIVDDSAEVAEVTSALFEQLVMTRFIAIQPGRR
jgi:hypothetical protein